ncbi:ATP-binding protein [Oxalobacteraceae bacterium R-40]|uniref:histidine kinase n=1 Tax=Keguizhuia sedimenti TaxID=3064264 RepID=A0ABU1BTG7_9BURK|nr:ATP-binding protein [Oxalobacteraceae bacterium R-40]
MAALASHENLQDLAKRNGVSIELVTKWKHELLSDAVRAFDEPTAHAVGSSEISKRELALAIAENSTQGFAMMDERGYCIYANHAWLQMTGYTAEELGSTVLHDLVPRHYPDGRPYLMAECLTERALPENFAVCAHEDLFFRKDGTAFPVMCSASPIFRDGRRVATVIEIRDITERKRIDEELRRTTKRQAFQLQLAECLRELSNPEEITEAASRLLGLYLNVGRVGYAETDLAGKRVSVHRDWTSSAMSSLAGEARPLDRCGLAIINELQNGTTVRLDDIVEDERSAPDRDGYACIGVRSMIAVPLIEEHRLTAILYLHESAPRAWMEEEVRLAEDAARWTWEAVKHARAEQTLREETRMLELLNQTGQIVSSTLDMQTLLQSITDTATQLSGAQFGAFFYTAKNEQGDAFTLYTLSGAPREAFDQFGHPRATPLFAPTFKGAPAIRSDDVTKDARYGKCGPHHGMPPKHLPVRSYLAVPVTARSGEVLGALLFGHPDVGVFTERTERIIAGVASQAAVAIDNARLYEQAQKAAQEREDLLTRERAAREEAERLSRMKDEFLAMLAHELRNPLAPISAAADLLNIMYANDPHVQQTSEIISRQVTHMTRLVDDLLDVSRVTRGFVTLNKAIIDFRHVVAGALDQVRPLIEQKRHQVATRLPSEPVYVHGDETRLVQTVSNILNNAAKYTPEDGNIDIKLNIADELLQLHIKDNGSGIAPELLPDVFGLFTQGARTLARSQGGLGLGLALAKKLVELHGGQVSAYSAGLGKGSEFIVSLPLASSVPQAPDQVHPALKLDASKSGTLHPQALRLTIVDDNIDAADMLASLLRAQGHTVSVYYRAQDALNSATRDVPHAFLLDIGLPDMDGYELARRLRAQPETAGSTLVAVTGYGQAQDREQSRAAGFSFHLVKPVDVHALTTLLKDIAAVRVMQS